MTDKPAKPYRADDVLPEESLRLVRLFLSIESREKRDAVYQMVEKYVRELKAAD